MTTPQLPFPDFGGVSGNLNLSEFDANFAYLLSLFAGLTASSVPFVDSVGIGANNVQAALVSLYELAAAHPSLTLVGTPPSSGTVGETYFFSPILLGGTPPYTFEQIGTLAPEFRFNATTGMLWAVLQTPGVYSGLRITVTDGAGRTAELSSDPFTITIAASGSPGTLDFSNPDNSGLIG